MNVSTVGLDIAKQVIQIHAVDLYGKPVIRKQLKRHQVLPFFANLFGMPCRFPTDADKAPRPPGTRPALGLLGGMENIPILALRASSFVFQQKWR
jgi:transposase